MEKDTLLDQAKSLAAGLGIDFYIRDGKIYQKDPGGGTLVEAPKNVPALHGSPLPAASEQK